MRGLDRRRFLAGAALTGSVALAGCTGTLHRVRGVDTPLLLVVEVRADEPRSLAVRIDRDGRRVLDSAVEFDADGHLAAVEGDDIEDVTFETAGEYTVTAESGELREESSREVSWRDLADCNGNGIEVVLDGEDLRVGFWQTDMACSGLDQR